MAKILLIDDDAQVLEVMTIFLEREQHDVSTAVDGKQGIRLLETHQFDTCDQAWSLNTLKSERP